MVPSNMQDSHAVCTDALIYHDRCLLLHLSLMKFWMVSLVSETENTRSIFPRNKLKLICVQHTFPLSSWLSEIISGPENPVKSLHRIYVFLSPSLIDIQVAFLDDSGFSKYSWAHVAIINTAAWWFLMQYYLRAQSSSTFSWGFLPCSTCTVIALDSLNRFTILHVVVGERPTFLATLHCKMWFLICLTLLSWNLPQSDEPWSSFACKAWDAPFIPKQDTLTYYQFTWYWELFQNHLKWIFYNLFTFIWPLSQLFWIVLQPSQSKFAHIYKIHLRWSLYFCQLNKS